MKAEQPPQSGSRVPLQMLAEVSEDEADGALHDVYEDIKRCLGVSLVGGLFKTLGPYPKYLEQAWRGLRANTLSPAFDSAANQVRAEAVRLISQWPSFGCDLPLLARLGYLPADIEHLKSGMATFHYLNPQLLMWASAVRQAREAPLGYSAAPKEMPEPDPGRPVVIHLMSPADAPPEVAIRYAWLQRLLGTPVVHADFQFLGSYPTYFYQLYSQLQDLVHASAFLEAGQALGNLATRLASHLPYRFTWSADDEEAEQRIDHYHQLLPRLILLTAMVNRRLGSSSEYYVR